MIKAEIIHVAEDSIAEELEIEPGDCLLKINGKEITDIVEYEHAIYVEELEIEIWKKSINEIWELELEKDQYEDLGIEFKDAVFDRVKTCKNNCLFCFVSQLPQNMRKNLYIKDEDFRMSYLFGSYMTLSNMTDADFNRIVEEKLSPLYISVHATEPTVRENLMKNSDAGTIMEKLKKLIDNGIELHTQAVVVPGINDGKVLEKTITDLASLYPGVKSLTVVPVGLTKYHRNGLRLFNKEECEDVVTMILQKSREFKKNHKTNFVFLADEFFVKGEIDIPQKEYYEEFEHIENGVGLLRLLLDEADKFKKKKKIQKSKKCTIACGESAYRYLKEIFAGDENITVTAVKNYFFGESITVTGLITGGDLIKNFNGHDIGEELIINRVMLNDDMKFLDDLTVKDIEKALKVKVRVVEKIEEIYK
jgi:putative radical SAM enzyme (TIGR03279 family)